MAEKKTKLSTVPVCYIKMKRYVAAYMKCVYGGEPLLFPSTHPVTLIMERHMVVDDEEKVIPTHCMTEKLWHIVREQAEKKGLPGEWAGLFDDEFALEGNTKLLDNWKTDASTFACFQLPERGFRRGGFIVPGINTRISERGVTEIRETLNREFWAEMFLFVRDEKIRVSKMGNKINQEHIFENFCTLYEINIQEIDNLQRKYRVELDKIMSEIAQRRRRINASATDFLTDGKPMDPAKPEKRTYQEEAIMNYREDPGQKRGE